MKVRFSLFVIVVAVLFTIAGCAEDPTPTHPLDVLNIPETGYEQCFSPVESAVLYVGDTKQTIETDDPRLMGVLNFIGYAVENKEYVYTQGFFEEDEIKPLYSSGKTMLEVSFFEETELNSEHRFAPKMLVCGNSYLLFLPNGVNAVQYWPYRDYAPEGEGLVTLFPDGETWLDILEYCGF